MRLTLPSFAKINWTLEILGKRPDGYHELRTLLQTVSVGDELSFASAEQGITLQCNHPDLPTDETNLVARAAKLLAEFTGCQRGARITLDKRLPLAAGLGGGSSNAAMTLLALQRLWGVSLSTHELFTLGARLGADVPFFFLGGTCIGVGRGDEVYPLPDIVAEHLLLVNAGIHVPTREVYDRLPNELTSPDRIPKMPASLRAVSASMNDLAARKDDSIPLLHNDLELPVLPRHPLLAELKARLRAAGATGTLMSGSGSTVFGLFESAALRAAAREQLQTFGWWCAAARALGRADYQARLRQALAGA